MIFIKENQSPTDNIIPAREKIIGVENNNMVDTRTFVFPLTFKGLELTDNDYVFSLLIQPVSHQEPPYIQTAEKEISERDIRVDWRINRFNTKQNGEIGVSVLIQNASEDIVWQSFKMEFIVERGITATEVLAETPPQIFEQAVAESLLHAQNAKIEADRTLEIAKIVAEMYDEMNALYNKIKSLEEL